jgi:glycosyltransferase involved in cell wall biosynthesis
VKFLFVAPRFHTNQIPLAEALLAAGHEVHYDVLFEGASEDHSVLKPHRVAPAPLSRLHARLRTTPDSNLATFHADWSFPSFVPYLRRLRELNPDVVVIRDPNRPFSALAAIAARLLRLRLVFYTQGDVHGTAGRWPRLLRGSLIRAFDAPWYSPVPGDRLLPRIHEHLFYLPFAADLSRAQKRTWFRGGRVNMLAIGKFTEGKNHLMLLRSFKRLIEERPLHLTLVGEVSNTEHRRHHAEVLDFIEQAGLGDHVTVRTNVPFVDVAELYEQHDLFVLPSRNEPAGVSILEAMAHGLPVVCSSTSGTRWYIDRGSNGEVFLSDDEEDLTLRLTGLVADRPRLEQMGERSRELAETEHHPERVVREFMKIVHARAPVARGSAGQEPL